MDKTAARKTGLKARRNMTPEQRAEADALLCSGAFQFLAPYHTVGIYVSARDEADTRQLIQKLLDSGKCVCIPRVCGKTLTFHRITTLEGLVKSSFGIDEPEDKDRMAVADIEVMIVPLSAFDKAGHRTGYGRGFYDSVLNDSALKIGYAYPCQEVDSIDTDPWDVDLDGIMTICERMGEKSATIVTTGRLSSVGRAHPSQG